MTEGAPQVVKIIPTKVWIESDIAGDRHVVVQHQDGKSQPFTFATFHYHYLYTDNHGTRSAAEQLARQLGAVDPVEHRFREIQPVGLHAFNELMLGKGWTVPACHCEACDTAANQGFRSRMSLCPQCGDKRCPYAAHHDNACQKDAGST